jgi:hypothetical protein
VDMADCTKLDVTERDADRLVVVTELTDGLESADTETATVGTLEALQVAVLVRVSTADTLVDALPTGEMEGLAMLLNEGVAVADTEPEPRIEGDGLAVHDALPESDTVVVIVDDLVTELEGMADVLAVRERVTLVLNDIVRVADGDGTYGFKATNVLPYDMYIVPLTPIAAEDSTGDGEPNENKRTPLVTLWT